MQRKLTHSILGANLKQLGILDNIQFRGHAIEVRLCAEDPDNDFSPRTGVIRKWSPADATQPMPGVRYDTGVEDGSEISIYYDSMIAKVIVHAPTRIEAVRRMATVLARTVILGVITNQKFLISIMTNPRFQLGTFDTNFIPIERDRLFPSKTVEQLQSSIIAATLFDWVIRKTQRVPLRNIQPNWRNVKSRVSAKKFLINDLEQFQVKYDYIGETQPKRHAFQCGVSPVTDNDKTKNVQEQKQEDLPLSVVLYEANFGKETPGPRGVEGCAGLLRCSVSKYEGGR